MSDHLIYVDQKVVKKHRSAAAAKAELPRLTAINKRHGALIRVLRDRLLVKRIEYKNPLLEVVGVVLQKGLIVAAGPGRRRKRMTRFDGMPGAPPSYFEDGAETGAFKPMDLKVGDFVEFGHRNQIEWELEGEKYVWIWRNACYGTTTASQHEAMLFQNSAGFDRKGNFMSGAESWMLGK